MGQTLSEPITSKRTSHTANPQMTVTSSSMQGWRITMEDAHTQLLSLAGDPTASFFAVFDGHGGSATAQYVSKHLHQKIASQQAYKQGEIEEALRRAFLDLDNAMFHDSEFNDDISGTTANTVLLKNKQIYCANAGDSRAVASVSGHVQMLSHDHKPTVPEERARIYAAGGYVELNRVNGNLALSRALGDFAYKGKPHLCQEKQIVTANPEVIVKPITSDHEFVVLACDGIWDVMTNAEVVNFIRSRLAKNQHSTQICEDLLNNCLAPDCHTAGLGCDNMTVVLVCFLNGGTIEELGRRCSKKPLLDDNDITHGNSMSISSTSSSL